MDPEPRDGNPRYHATHENEMTFPTRLRLGATQWVPNPIAPSLQPPIRPRVRAALPGRLKQAHRSFTILGIETSCDDTGVAVLRTSEQHPSRARLLFNKKTTSDHRRYGGVFPPAAIRGHAEALPFLGREAVDCARSSHEGESSNIFDLIAVTRGPGMSQNLSEGLAFAKGLAVAWSVPIVGVNHMQAHALTPRLADALERVEARPSEDQGEAERDSRPESEETSPSFPFLSLLVSGGHTQLVHSTGVTNHRILINASNIAIGDSLDKCARLILPPDLVSSNPDVMYGRALEAFAFPPEHPLEDYEYRPPQRRRDDIAHHQSVGGWSLLPPMATNKRLEYDFSILLSHIMNILASRPDIQESVELRRVLARDVMKVAFEHLIGRLFIAAEHDPTIKEASTMVISGGVAANKFLMRVVREMLAVRGMVHLEVMAPPVELCTDNAAMIAWAGWEMWRAGWTSGLRITALKNWSVDEAVEGGILGATEWVKRDR